MKKCIICGAEATTQAKFPIFQKTHTSPGRRLIQWTAMFRGVASFGVCDDCYAKCLKGYTNDKKSDDWAFFVKSLIATAVSIWIVYKMVMVYESFWRFLLIPVPLIPLLFVFESVRRIKNGKTNNKPKNVADVIEKAAGKYIEKNKNIPLEYVLCYFGENGKMTDSPNGIFPPKGGELVCGSFHRTVKFGEVGDITGEAWEHDIYSKELVVPDEIKKLYEDTNMM